MWVARRLAVRGRRTGRALAASSGGQPVSGQQSEASSRVRGEDGAAKDRFGRDGEKNGAKPCRARHCEMGAGAEAWNRVQVEMSDLDLSALPVPPSLIL